MSATPEKIAEWCVLLNCWLWPHDLPGKPNPPGGLSWREEQMAVRGAHAAMEASADPDLVDQIWNSPRREELIQEHDLHSIADGGEPGSGSVITAKGRALMEAHRVSS